MKVFSGRCCFCDVGRPTGNQDMHGNELFTGDIVQLWNGHFIGTELEEWFPCSGLTAIVAEQYQSYARAYGEVDHVLVDDDAKPFTMGIKSIGVQGGDWKVSLVKSHKDIVEGERFISYGFSFRSI